jgi:hypothetical protein
MPTLTLEKQEKKKKKRIEGEREIKKKQREKIYARVMKKTEEVNKEKVVVSLV